MISTESNKAKDWIKELVRMEQDMESKGQVSIPEVQPSQAELKEHTLEFMKQLKTAFATHSALFNHIKGFLGSLRIYGIANTSADFMLFRNGHKLVFSIKEPGLISVCMKFNDQFLAKSSSSEPADFIKGEWGPFNELKWTYNNQKININYLIRYYITAFVKNSVK